jgi:multidrug efflux pump subunit AcrA (membrane-fusion protein)
MTAMATASRVGRHAAIVLAIAAVLASAACSSRTEATTTVTGPAAELEVTRGDLRDRVLLTGQLDAVLSKELAAPRTRMHGMSIRWMAEDGAEVAAGDRVLEFDNSSFASGLEEQRLAVTRANNDLQSQAAANQVAIAEKEYAVARRRIELDKAALRAKVPEDTYTRREYQERQLTHHKAKVELERAEDDLRAQRKASALDTKLKRIALDKIRREVATTEGLLDSFVMMAPRSGIIVAAIHPWFGRKIQLGDMVRAGMTVLTLPNLDNMQVEAALSDVDDGRVSVGMKVACTLDAYPERRYPGTVKTLSPVAKEPQNESLRRSFRVVVALADADSAGMLPGMSVKVEVEGRSVEDAVIAPRAGLDLTTTPRRAFLASGGSAEVELGLCTADGCEVKSGLEPGTRLRAGGGS